MTGGCIPARRGRIPALPRRRDALHKRENVQHPVMSHLDLNSFDVVVPDYELQAGSLQLVATPRVETVSVRHCCRCTDRWRLQLTAFFSRSNEEPE